MQAIASIAQPTLSYLDLGYNKYLWEYDSRFDLLLDVIQQQHNLDYLHLNESIFSPVQTEQLLRKITKFDILWSITTINLSTANFESDESVNHLTLILAKAHRIKQVEISIQQGKRKIDVKVDEEKEWEDEYGDTLEGGVIFENSEKIIIFERGQ